MGVEAQKGEGIAALAGPLVHAALDVGRSADFEENGLLLGFFCSMVRKEHVFGSSSPWGRLRRTAGVVP